MIKVRQPLLVKCRDHGEYVVEGYKQGKWNVEAAVNGIELDPLRQAEAKLGECVFAIERGLDPEEAIDWMLPEPQRDNIDLTTKGITVDVKQTYPYCKLLIQSVGKIKRSVAETLGPKKFDRFVLVKAKLDLEGGYSTGWIKRVDFIKRHRIAAKDNPLKLIPGTPYMEENELKRMTTFDDLEEIARPDGIASSTWDAFMWVRKYAPERREAFVADHPVLRNLKTI